MTSSLREDFNRFIYGSLLGNELIQKMKKSISKQMLQEHGLVNPREIYQLSERESMRFLSEKYLRGFRMTKELKGGDQILRNLNVITPTYGFYLNFNAFLVTIELLGDSKQAEFWKDEVLSGRVVGGYGQTEIGHGSNVKGLQTTATYDEKKQVWVINSPTVTSTKFWPGLLGHFSTHQVIQAKTFVKGKSIGIQTFVLQIRNEKLQDVQNVVAFDLGPKLGFEMVDNGGLILKNFEAPRNSMLMKYVTVNSDGSVDGLQNSSAIKYSYGSMLNLRVQLVFGFFLQALATPVCSFYMMLKDEGVHLREDNRKYIIDKLCIGFGGCLCNLQVLSFYQQFKKQVQNKNYPKADSLLAKVHIISSTFKALSSRIAMDIGTELVTLRNFSKFRTSKFVDNFVTYVPSTTYEGDNSVLLQQTSNFILFKTDVSKEFGNLRKAFLSTSWSDAANAIEYVVTQRLIEVKKSMEAHEERDQPFKKIMNELEQVNFIRLAEIWGFMTMLRMLEAVLPTIQTHKEFYFKICAGFTSFVVGRVPELQVYGFVVEEVEAWRAFTDEEYCALAEINTPVETDFESMKYLPRDGQWLQAKL